MKIPNTLTCSCITPPRKASADNGKGLSEERKPACWGGECWPVHVCPRPSATLVSGIMAVHHFCANYFLFVANTL